MNLSRNQIDLILYSLEQQQIEFNDAELKYLDVIVNELSIARELSQLLMFLSLLMKHINSSNSMTFLETWTFH